MRRATLTMTAVLLAGFLASEAVADHGSHGLARHYGAGITTARHGYPGHSGYRGPHGYHGYHGAPGRHGAYYRPPYGHLPYGYPVIVRPPACGYRAIPYPAIYGARRYDPYSSGSFYYQGRNLGIGVRF